MKMTTAPSSTIVTVEKLALKVGPLLTRYALVVLLLMFGALKWTSGEAQAIQPLILHSPLLGWLYGVLGVQGTSIFFGVFEIAAALAIATRPWLPTVSAAGSGFGVIIFLTTLSFLFTTPGVMATPFGAFILKDIVLLGASVWTAGEALGS